VHDFREQGTARSFVKTAQQIEGKTGQKLVLIVIDTLSRALCGGDENSSKDMGAVVAATSILQNEAKAHVLWVHHMPQAGAERLRGHGALLGALDTTVHVTKHSEDLRSATVVKANDSEEGEGVTFSLEGVDIGANTTAPVVVPVDPGVARNVKSTGKRWTRGLHLIHESIVAAFNEGQSIEHRVADDGPTVRAIFVEDARPFHRERYVHGGDGDRAEAERKAWQRNLQGARNRQLIGSRVTAEGREIVWLVGASQ
jgi:hypothetical protein